VNAIDVSTIGIDPIREGLIAAQMLVRTSVPRVPGPPSPHARARHSIGPSGHRRERDRHPDDPN